MSDISLWLTHPHCQMLSEFLRTKQKSSVSMAVTPSFECIIIPSVKRVITELSCDRHSHCHPQYIIAPRICQSPFADFHSIYIIYIYYVSTSTHFIVKKIWSLSTVASFYCDGFEARSRRIGIRRRGFTEPRQPSKGGATKPRAFYASHLRSR